MNFVKLYLAPSWGAYLFLGLKRGELIREGDLLIIQGKKCYKNALMHFLLCRNCANSIKSLLTLFKYNVLIIHQLSLNSYS